MVSFSNRYQYHQIRTSPPSGQSRHHRLPLVLTYPSASLPPLQVTLTRFTLSSYEQALRLLTSFPISGLARHGVKPRLCRSSWRTFASTHPLMLPSTSPREALACLPFPPHALVLIPFSLAKVRFSLTLSLSPLMIWYSGLAALFLFLLVKAAPAFLPTALSVALRPLFPFRQAQFVLVFPLKSAPFYTLFAGLCSTNKSATSLLLSDSRSVLPALSSLSSFLLPQTLWQIWQELSSLLFY